MMLQAQRSVHRTTGSRSVSTAPGRGSYAVSQSTTSRRTALAQSYYEDAKMYVTRALSEDESGDQMAALEWYNKALSTLTSGLDTLQDGDGTLRDVRTKMEKMRGQVKSRMEVLIQLETEARKARGNATRAQTTSGLASTTSKTRSSSLPGTRSEAEVAGGREGGRVSAKADLVFHVDSDIGLFEVDSREHVRKYDDIDTLNVFRYQERIEGQPPAFLQCGGFVYPLVPGKSPVLKAGERTYMFPELQHQDGSSVGIVLGSASEEEIQELDHMLSLLSNLKTADLTPKPPEPRKDRQVEGPEDKPTWGTVVAGGIDKGVGWVSTKLSQGTEVAGNLISQGATKLRERIEPNETPTEIPESVQKGVRVARKASGYVVGVSDFLMLSLAKLTVKVGKEVKNVVAESEAVKNAEINPHAKEAWKVTKSSVKGAAAVFGDLEKSAVALLKNVGGETSKTMGHKYGETAGKVTDDSLHTAANVTVVAHTYWSWKTWGIHFLGKVGQVIRQQDQQSNSTNKDGYS